MVNDTRYFCTADRAWLEEVNSRGIIPGNVTTSWVTIIKHPDRDEYAACIPVSFLPRLGTVLTPAELENVANNLQSFEDLDSKGWFTPFNQPSLNIGFP